MKTTCVKLIPLVHGQFALVIRHVIKVVMALDGRSRSFWRSHYRIRWVIRQAELAMRIAHIGLCLGGMNRRRITSR
jgi:hypothetical protein